jgi:hypothetical protein
VLAQSMSHIHGLTNVKFSVRIAEHVNEPPALNIVRSHTKLAPAVGFEPTTNRLTADRSTTELRWIFYSADWRG